MIRTNLTAEQARTEPTIVAGSGRVVPSWVLLALVCLGQFMVVLDISIVNVALPSIQAELGFTPLDPGRTGVHRIGPAVGGQRLHADVRRLPAAGRPGR